MLNTAGFIIVLVGLGAIVLGLVMAWREHRKTATFDAPTGGTNWGAVFAEIVKALKEAPMWLALCVIGFVMTLLGAWMLAGAPLPGLTTGQSSGSGSVKTSKP